MPCSHKWQIISLHNFINYTGAFIIYKVCVTGEISLYDELRRNLTMRLSQKTPSNYSWITLYTVVIILWNSAYKHIESML